MNTTNDNLAAFPTQTPGKHLTNKTFTQNSRVHKNYST